MERFLDYPGGTNVITRIFIREVGCQEEEGMREQKRCVYACAQVRERKREHEQVRRER